MRKSNHRARRSCAGLIVALAILAACAPRTAGPPAAITPAAPTADSTGEPTPVLDDPAPEIRPLGRDQVPEQAIARIFAPEWETAWLLGRLVDHESSLAYYANAWMDREGHGALTVSSALNRLQEPSEDPSTLPIAAELLSDGKKILENGDSEWLHVEGQWAYHPFETADRFVSLFFPLKLAEDSDWQVIGESSVAERQAIVLQQGDFRVWVDAETGALLRLEQLDPSQANALLVSIQVEEVEYNLPIPARTLQAVGQWGHQPNLAERPADKVVDLSGKPLNFHNVTKDVVHPLAGLFADVYQGHSFLGTLDLGSAGFYCDRASDGNHFAFLYQKPGSQILEVRWVDLRDIQTVHTIGEIQSPSSPTWSPTDTRLAITGLPVGEEPHGKTFLVDIPSGAIEELGPGSLVPPAWTDDGKYVFGLDPTFDYLLLFDSDSGELESSWEFDSEPWQVTDSSAPIENKEVEAKLPRHGFDYHARCSPP
ncbi:MAG TPA: hypothetical protein VFF68_08270 [Anaerolineaceae bacterium]|nr:hypothetical protein [Anaerolineaceae bacterium]